MISAMKKRISNNKGLTLIELIIVIAIIGILAVIGITQFGGVTEGARVEADKAVIEQIENAAKLYIATNNKTPGDTVTITDLKESSPAVADDPTTTDVDESKAATDGSGYIDDFKFQSKDYKGQEDRVTISYGDDGSITVSVTKNS